MGVRHLRRVAGMLAVTLLAATLVAGCAASLDDDVSVTGVDRVLALDDYFEDRVIQVAAGTEVTWEFAGRRRHNVVGGGWHSDLLLDGTYSRVFEEPGTYDYLCTLHGGMRGRVIVTP